MSREASFWLDANVLLRFLTGSPPELAGRVARLLEEAQRGVISLRVHPVVAERFGARVLLWVLQSGDLRRPHPPSGATRPAGRGRKGHRPGARCDGGQHLDFAEALLTETARSRVEGIASFDKDFRKLDVEWREPD